jgi:hypothetical protein
VAPSPAPSDPDEPSTAHDAARGLPGVIAGVTASLLHLVVGVFVLSSGLLAPGWAVVLLAAVWAALWLAIWRWRRTSPIRTMLVPFGMAALWWVTISAGERWLGWTA